MSITKITHIDARSLLREGWRRCYGSEALTSLMQCVQAVGWLETNYGMGWSEGIPGAAGSNNWGAITGGSGWTGATFEHRDSYPDDAGVNHWYTTEFRAYRTPQDGASDLVNIVYLTRDKSVVQAAMRGDTLGFSTALYRTGYYKGFGATEAERIAHHHTAVLGAIALQVQALGENAPQAITPAQLEQALQAAEQTSRVQHQCEAWLATLDAALDGHGASNIPAELDTHDTDPAPPPSEEPNT